MVHKWLSHRFNFDFCELTFNGSPATVRMEEDVRDFGFCVCDPRRGVVPSAVTAFFLAVEDRVRVGQRVSAEVGAEAGVTTDAAGGAVLAKVRAA